MFPPILSIIGAVLLSIIQQARTEILPPTETPKDDYKYCPNGCECLLPTTSRAMSITCQLDPNSGKTQLPRFGENAINLDTLTIQGYTLNDTDQLHERILTHVSSVNFLVLSGLSLSTVNPKHLQSLASKIRKLDLAHNKLKSAEFLEDLTLTSLTELELRNNQITQLSAQSLAGLTSLQKLSLDQNPLSLSNLHFLDSGALTNLNELQANEINLTSVGDSDFSKIKEIRILGLSGNQLQTLSFLNEPANKPALLHLLSLSLNDNLLGENEPIRIEWFEAMQFLRYLYLRGNRIQDTAFLASPALNHLYEINLDKNLITGSLDNGEFNHTCSLRKISLQDNYITSLNFCIFNRLAKLKQLYFTSNPIVCDCRATWIRQSAAAEDQRKMDPVDCPGDLAEYQVDDFPFNVNTCPDDDDCPNVTKCDIVEIHYDPKPANNSKGNTQRQSTDPNNGNILISSPVYMLLTLCLSFRHFIKFGC